MDAVFLTGQACVLLSPQCLLAFPAVLCRLDPFSYRMGSYNFLLTFAAIGFEALLSDEE